MSVSAFRLLALGVRWSVDLRRFSARRERGGRSPASRRRAWRIRRRAAALLNRYCVTCHNERLKTGGLALDKLDVGERRPARATCGKRSCGSFAPASCRRPAGRVRTDRRYEALAAWNRGRSWIETR